MHDITQRFTAALDQLHRSRDAGPLTELFADDATLSKAGKLHEEHGKDGARAFWQQYRDVFDTVEAEFHQVVQTDGIAYLEWTSRGTLRDGNAFRYEGISVLEARDDTIEAFRTYYDTAAFLGRKA